jgi:hypothetical protein
MKTTFYELPVGARFEFRGRRYEKVALSMAGDEERCGSVFHDNAEVVWDPQMQSAECRAQGVRPRRAPEPSWWSYMSPAPSSVESTTEGRPGQSLRTATVADERSHLTMNRPANSPSPPPSPSLRRAGLPFSPRRGEAVGAAARGADSWQ